MNNALASSRVVVAQQQGAPNPFVLPDQSVRPEHLSPETLLKLLPAGTILHFAGSTPPVGYLVCDGSSVNRQAYASLFAAVGTMFGAPDANSFNLPDLRGKVVVADGQDTARGLSSRTLGQVFGEEAHVLSLAELASHNHSDSGHAHGVYDPGHAHYFGYRYIGYGGVYDGHMQWNGGSDGIGYTTAVGTGIGIYGASANIQASGGNAAHNNMQPSLVLRAMIKY